MRQKVDALLVLPRIKVQNANAVSGPLTWGFPAMTAIIGFVHALYRKTTSQHGLEFDGVGVVCHDFNPMVYRSSPTDPIVFRLMRHPNDKDGETPAFIEEGRVHLEVSLVIGLRGEALFDGSFDAESSIHGVSNEMTDYVHDVMSLQRFAGGSILSSNRPYAMLLPSSSQDIQDMTRRFVRKFLPGFAVISREDVFQVHLEETKQNDEECTNLDALLDFCSLKYESVQVEDTGEVEWAINKKLGWFVPMPVGFGAISDLYEPGDVANVRDKTIPFRFVESIYSVGQWISPHRIGDIRDLLWYYSTDSEKGIYRCVNVNQYNKNVKEDINYG